MKRILGFIAAIFMLSLLLPSAPARASGPLDEISNYTITVDPREDGTLDIKYHIDWLVLDSTSEGPLTWVKIGIPNSHVDAITPLSPTIKKIGYLDDSGSYVRIDLDRSYNADETASFDFSIHQSYMYRLSIDTCSFTFVPGWFDGIKVDSFKLLWNKTSVIYSDSAGTEGNYLVWQKPLDPGERYTVIVRYGGDAFETVSGEQADMAEQKVPIYSSGPNYGMIIFVVLFIVIVIAVAAGGGNNRYRGGFGGRGGFSGGSRGGGCACAHSCACACACACAGGGRAGCSAKSFYGTAVETSGLKDRLVHQ